MRELLRGMQLTFFQLWKEKKLIAHVDGANAPELARLIAEHVPDVPE